MAALLPVDVILVVCSFSTASGSVALCSACAHYRAVLKEPRFWALRAHLDFGIVPAAAPEHPTAMLQYQASFRKRGARIRALESGLEERIGACTMLLERNDARVRDMQQHLGDIEAMMGQVQDSRDAIDDLMSQMDQQLEKGTALEEQLRRGLNESAIRGNFPRAQKFCLHLDLRYSVVHFGEGYDTYKAQCQTCRMLANVNVVEKGGKRLPSAAGAPRSRGRKGTGVVK